MIPTWVAYTTIDTPPSLPPTEYEHDGLLIAFAHLPLEVTTISYLSPLAFAWGIAEPNIYPYGLHVTVEPFNTPEHNVAPTTRYSLHVTVEPFNTPEHNVAPTTRYSVTLTVGPAITPLSLPDYWDDNTGVWDDGTIWLS